MQQTLIDAGENCCVSFDEEGRGCTIWGYIPCNNPLKKGCYFSLADRDKLLGEQG